MSTEESAVARGEETNLIRRAKLGDHMAFNCLVAPYRPKITSICRSWFKTECDVEDATQITLQNVWNSLGELREDAAFENWLRTIARNACASLRRRARNEVSLDDADLLAFAEQPDIQIDM